MCSTAARVSANGLEFTIHDVGVDVSQRGMEKSFRRRPTISNSKLCQSRTARSFVLTTKLNCIARKPRSRARPSECSHIERATPRPVAVSGGHVATVRNVSTAALLIGLQKICTDNLCRCLPRRKPRAGLTSNTPARTSYPCRVARYKFHPHG